MSDDEDEYVPSTPRRQSFDLTFLNNVAPEENSLMTIDKELLQEANIETDELNNTQTQILDVSNLSHEQLVELVKHTNPLITRRDNYILNLKKSEKEYKKEVEDNELDLKKQIDECDKNLKLKINELKKCTADLTSHATTLQEKAAIINKKTLELKKCQESDTKIIYKTEIDVNINNELEEIKQQLEKTKKKLTEQTLISNNQQTLNKKLTEANEEFNNENNKLNQDLDLLQNELKKKERELDQLSTIHTELQQQLEKTQNNNNNTKELDMIRNELKMCNERNARIANDTAKKQLEAKISDLSSKINELNTQISNDKTKTDALQTQIDKKKQQINEKEQEIEQIKNKIAELQACCNEKKLFEQKLKECESKQEKICEEKIQIKKVKVEKKIDEIGEIVISKLKDQLDPQLIELLNPKPNKKTFIAVSQKIINNDNSETGKKLKNLMEELTIVLENKKIK